MRRSVVSTVEDLLLWDQALSTEKLVSKTDLESMFTSVKANYGYGWFGERFNHKYVEHVEDCRVRYANLTLSGGQGSGDRAEPSRGGQPREDQS